MFYLNVTFKYVTVDRKNSDLFFAVGSEKGP